MIIRVGPRTVLLAAILLLQAARAEATVPMNPEYLPEAGLLLAGVFVGAMALYRILTRQPSRALRAGAVSLACISLALVLVGNCHSPVGPPALLPAAKNSMSLVLGDVILRVTPSDQYVLSVDHEQVLELDLCQSGLRVSGVIGAHDRVATDINQNTFPSRQGRILPAKPDAHTLLVQEEGEEIFRSHYSEPLRIEITGQFFGRRSVEPAAISFQKGIHWSGGAVQPGTVIDLRDQGRGWVDFGGSGAIRILPHG
jgi:hypothetical protein